MKQNKEKRKKEWTAYAIVDNKITMYKAIMPYYPYLVNPQFEKVVKVKVKIINNL